VTRPVKLEYLRSEMGGGWREVTNKDKDAFFSKKYFRKKRKKEIENGRARPPCIQIQKNIPARKWGTGKIVTLPFTHRYGGFKKKEIEIKNRGEGIVRVKESGQNEGKTIRVH